ncbi:MipA/OmpV family protein [Pokkaliibacter sp. CJK22405]|uniref:MipA/OmpV family protein n=1 Tax=Pokkaliibacter sp. CJK22405 TaxID=3384615 RepID=UPI0039848CE8
MKLRTFGILTLTALPVLSSSAFAEDGSQWGLGVGAGYSSSFYDGKDNDTSALPLVYFDNSWVRFSGTTLDIKIKDEDNLTLTLRAKAALGDGYDSGDSSKLRGMDDRDGGLWVGPHMAYEFGQNTLSLDVLGDASGNSEGWQSTLGYEYNIQLSERLSITPSAKLSYLNSDYVNYYYGVKTSEARADRQAYNPGASWTYGAGVDVGFYLTRHQRLNFSMGVDAAADEIKDSPIVDDDTVMHAGFSYLYLF